MLTFEQAKTLYWLRKRKFRSENCMLEAPVALVLALEVWANTFRLLAYQSDLLVLNLQSLSSHFGSL